MVASVTAGVINVLLVSAAVSLLSGTAIRPFVKTVEAQMCIRDSLFAERKRDRRAGTRNRLGVCEKSVAGA